MLQDFISSGFPEAEWLQQLYMQAPVAIAIYIGEEHIIEFANPLMCRLWDRSADQVLDKPLFKALPEVSGQGYEEILANVLASGEPFTGNELPAALERNGKLELFYFNILYKPLRNIRNNIVGVIQVATEVTELVEARKKAEQNEELMRMALESGKMGTWHMDFVQGTNVRSVEHDRIFGYPEAVLNWDINTFYTHVLPEDLAYARQMVERGMKEGSVNFEVRIRWQDGSIHWLCIKGKTAYNMKRKPVSMSGIVMDVSEQKQLQEKERKLAAEQAALEEGDRQARLLESLFMQAPAMIVSLRGPEYTIEFVNPGYQQLFPGRELKGKTIREALPELKDQPIMKILDQVYRSGETFKGKEVPIMLDRFDTGELKPVYFNFVYQASHNANGDVTGILVFAFEVTDQILAREEIESSKESLNLALESGKMGTWELDLMKNVSTRSIEHDLIFGYDRLLSEWGFDKFMEHIVATDREYVLDSFRQAKESGELSLETRINRVDQTERWIAIRGKAFFEDRKAVRLAGIVMDITERKEAEKKLQELSEQLANSNQELLDANQEISSQMMELSDTNHRLKQINTDLDNFVYTASHDLKAPIANLEGLMKVLVRHLPREIMQEEMVEKTLGLMNQSIDRFRNTILELTDIAKLQKEVEDISLVPLRSVIEEVLLDLQHSIEESGAEIELHVPEDLQLQFSYKHLNSVVYNLLSNALKYRSPERRPEVWISGRQDGNFTRLEVKDNGLGMKEKNREKIFQMFTRLHTHVEGSGVGLYLVKRIADNAGGRLEVESEEGKGSAFTLYLPLKDLL